MGSTRTQEKMFLELRHDVDSDKLMRAFQDVPGTAPGCPGEAPQRHRKMNDRKKAILSLNYKTGSRHRAAA
jgi:hypothetical protein